MLAGLALGPPTTGCSGRKLLRLENQVLEQDAASLKAELLTCQDQAPPPDFATEVDVEVIAEYLARAGFPAAEQASATVLRHSVEGRNTEFVLNVQLFPDEKVLFLAATRYLQLEDATSSKAMVLLLTQLAALNYDLLVGKFQLNPRSGDISLSIELQLDDGLGYRTFESAVHHLVRTADTRYPELLRAARGSGM